MVIKLICYKIDKKEILLGNKPISEIIANIDKAMTKE